MAMTDPRDISRFAEIMQAALPRAISETFGGLAEMPAMEGGTLPLLVMDLGRGHHLHLEIDVSVGGREPRGLLLVMRAADAQALFDLEPRSDESLNESDTQLIVLAEFTE